MKESKKFSQPALNSYIVDMKIAIKTYKGMNVEVATEQLIEDYSKRNSEKSISLIMSIPSFQKSLKKFS